MEKYENDILNDEERDMLDSIERGEWVALSQREQSVYIEMARNTLRENRNIQIDATGRDVNALEPVKPKDDIPRRTKISNRHHSQVCWGTIH